MHKLWVSVKVKAVVDEREWLLDPDGLSFINIGSYISHYALLQSVIIPFLLG